MCVFFYKVYLPISIHDTTTIIQCILTIYIYIYICVFMYVYVCVCVCVWDLFIKYIYIYIYILSKYSILKMVEIIGQPN